MDPLPNVDLDLLSLLRLYEGTRLVEDSTLAQLILDAECFEPLKGAVIDPWSDALPSLILILDGQVKATIDSHLNPAGHGLLQPEEAQAMSKILTRGSCLNSTSQLLGILSHQLTGQRHVPAGPKFGEARVVYEAVTESRLVKIALGRPEGVPKDVRSPMIQALLQKLFLVTFPVVETHFGLRHQVLQCEAKINSFSNPDFQKNPFSASTAVSSGGPGKSPRHVNHLSDPSIPSSHSLTPTRLQAGSISHRTSQTRRKTSLGSGSIQNPQLPRGKSRSNANLKLLTNMEQPKKPTDDSEDSVFSPSILSQTECKHEKFVHLKERTPGTELVKRRAAESILIMLSRPLEPEMQDNIWVDQTILNEIASSIEILSFVEGAHVVHQGERYPGICLVMDGILEASAKDKVNLRSTSSTEKLLPFRVGPGSIVGYSSLVLNNRSLLDFKAMQQSTIGILPRASVRYLAQLYPHALAAMAAKVCYCLPPLVSMIDFILDWSVVNAGAEIYRRGDPSNTLSFVIKGRVRINEEISNTEDTRIREFGPGNAFGVLEFHTSHPRPSTTQAIRKSEIAQLQKSSYQKLLNYTPALGFKLWDSINTAPQSSQLRTTAPESPDLNYPRTIAVFPLSVEVAAGKCATLLSSALVRLSIYSKENISFVEAQSVFNSIGSPVFTSAGRRHLEDYLAHVEENSSLSILVGEHPADSTWNEICMSMADLIVLLAMEDDDPVITDIEAKLGKRGILAQKILVLLDDGESELCPQPVTKSWIEKRPWLSVATSHIERARLSGIFACRDFERLARRITGHSIAVVLGGGGARGFAHLGTLKALEEEGIPFDIIGGTSMGAFVGALYAGHMSLNRTVEAARAFSKLSLWWKYLTDITMPILSLTSGSSFTNHVAAMMDRELDSSDLRLAFYCNATNMSQGGRGLTMYPQPRAVWQMVRASMGLPPIFPPFTLEGHGDLLVDGCFSANVPVFPALALGAEIVLAFDVSSTSESPPPQTLDQSVSGWYQIAQSIFPCGSKRKPDIKSPQVAVGADGNILNSMQLLELLTFSTNINEMKAIRNSPHCLYMMHDLGNMGPFSMGMFEEARQIGYENAKRWLQDLRTSGELAHLALPQDTKTGESTAS